MKRLLASLVLIVAAAALSGCYYDPGYSYVRGSAYYVAPGYYDGYYGGYYGCCYAPGVSVGVSSVWYGGSRYRHDGYRDHRDYRSHAGQWRGHGDGRSDYRGGSRDGNRQRRDSRSGDRDHRH
jgi:hypothetical protein